MLYLKSSEYERLKGPFACEQISNTYINKRQVLVVKIEPALAGIDYNQGFNAISHLLLIAKYKDKDLKKLSKFPIDVVVFIPDNLNEPLSMDRQWSEMQSIGWAELHDIYPKE